MKEQHKAAPLRRGSDWLLGKDFFIVRVVNYWNRLPREVVYAPCLSVSRDIWVISSVTCLNFWLVLKWSSRGTRWSLKVPSNHTILFYFKLWYAMFRLDIRTFPQGGQGNLWDRFPRELCSLHGGKFPRCTLSQSLGWVVP